MTIAPKRPCKNRRCNGLTREPNGYCCDCQSYALKREKAVRQEYNKRRDPQVKQWLNSARYRKARLHFLSQNPLCEISKAQGKIVPANILDHIIPHKGSAALFWDKSNWQALSKSAHDKKTASEDGGFNNPVRETR